MVATRSSAPANGAKLTSPPPKLTRFKQQEQEQRRHRKHARFYVAGIYAVWFACLAVGILAYQGEPILVKSKELPLHFFNEIFKRIGGVIILILWALRAAASRAYLGPSTQHHTNLHVWIPGAAYTFQTALRTGIYKLHMGGYILSPRHWHLPKPKMHPGHVMSDHILLGASLVGACACEAIIAVLSLRYARKHPFAKGFLLVYALLNGILAALVSLGSYFTSKYFHPPSEIILGGILGLVVFQAPLLLLKMKALYQHMAN